MYRVTSATGQDLGLVNGTAELKAMLDQHTGATYRAESVVEAPCAKHPAFEADYCPGCGTATEVERMCCRYDECQCPGGCLSVDGECEEAEPDATTSGVRGDNRWEVLRYGRMVMVVADDLGDDEGDVVHCANVAEAVRVFDDLVDAWTVVD